jgi:hypothetical protein
LLEKESLNDNPLVVLVTGKIGIKKMKRGIVFACSFRYL